MASSELQKQMRFIKKAGIGAKETLDGMFSTKGSGRREKKEAAMDYNPGVQLGPGFDKFWMLIEHEKTQCRQYLEGLLTQLTNVFAKRSKVKMPPQITVESLINTIQFVGLFYTFTPSNKMKTCMSAIIETFSRGPELNALKAISHRLAALEDPKQNEVLIKHFVRGLSVQQSPEVFNKMTHFIGFPTVNLAIAPRTENSFIYVFLREAANDKAKLKTIIDAAVKGILALPQFMQLNARVAEVALLAHMQLFRSLSPIMGNARANQLCNIIYDLQQFFFWPKPFGSITRTILTEMEKEVMCPGEGLREGLRYEARCARSKEGSSKFSDVDPVVYHIVNAKSSNADSLLHILQMAKEEGKGRNRNRLKIGEQSIGALARLILHTVNREVSVSKEDIDAFLFMTDAAVRRTIKEIDQMSESLYKSAIEGEKKVESKVIIEGERVYLTPQEATKRRIAFYTNMKKEWKENADNLEDDDQSISRFFPDVEVLYELQEAEFPFSLPPLRHKALRFNVQYTLSSREARRLARETMVLPPETDWYETLRLLVDGHLCGATPEKKVTIRMVMACCDFTMHAFLCAYVRLILHDYKLAKCVEFKMYIVPIDRGNHIAAFLSRHDGWYYKNIYAPFSSKQFLLPWVQLQPESHEQKSRPRGSSRHKAQNKSSGAGGALNELTGKRMRKYYECLLENYVRSAKEQLRVKIFMAKMYDGKPEWDHKADSKEIFLKAKAANQATEAITAEADQVVPFLQRLEIGYFAELKRYIELETRGGRYDVRKLEEKFIREKKFTVPEILIRAVTVGLDGKVLGVISEHSYLGFNRLSLANVPWHGENKDLPPNPQDPWLELTAEIATSSTKKSVFHSEPHQHVCRVEISSKGDERFSILIDGALFPPYSSNPDKSKLGYRTLVIERLVDAKKTGVDFPIQTFYPTGI
ncbi:hypothetical protein AAMO2058_001655100 [Amorphochlora amoebiformis]|mmetsp:Transcript_7258/g.11264  ORF Transcript_7258/g.11264 Transcript_7258/m.11264 type:complete len:928 (-) Transcript_7258:187-2970(-)